LACGLRFGLQLAWPIRYSPWIDAALRNVAMPGALGGPRVLLRRLREV